MSKVLLSVGLYVKLRGVASYYGTITRVNEKTFTVMDGNSMVYSISMDSLTNEYKGCRGDNHVRCEVLQRNSAEEKQAKSYLD